MGWSDGMMEIQRNGCCRGDTSRKRKGVSSMKTDEFPKGLPEPITAVTTNQIDECTGGVGV